MRREPFVIRTMDDLIVSTGRMTPWSIPFVDVIQAAHRRPDGSVAPRFERAALLDQLHDSVRATRRDRPRFVLALAGNDAVVGVGGYRPAWCSGFGWELAYGAVLPLWQGRGVGRALLPQRLDAIAAGGKPGDFVLATTRRPATFERLGFRRASSGDPVLMIGTVGLPLHAGAASAVRASA